jgi:methanogenic corrinoid protein MtbC1
VPSALVADLLRQRNLAVIDLGGDTPARSFVDTAKGADRLVAVGLCATTPDNLINVRDAVAALHDAVDAPVVLGGSAVNDRALADVGADEVTGSAEDAVALFEKLATEAAKARRRDSRRA